MRFFYPHPFSKDLSVVLQEEELHHLRVTRIKVGETIELINGQGGLALAKLQSIEKKQALGKITECQSTPPPPFEIILAQAIPRLNRLDTIVEKGTELGMSELWLFPGEKSERKNVMLPRLVAITIAAMKQCGRLWLPKITLQPPLHKWSQIKDPFFFGDLSPESPSFFTLLQKDPPKKKALFCVGPESGFSEREIEQLKKLGAQGVKLHPNILRTDTAPLVALSLLSQVNPDFSQAI